MHNYIIEKIGKGEKLHFTLIDPDKPPANIESIAKALAEAGTDAFLIGGSIGVTPEESTQTARILRETGLPVIVFPGNLNCLTPAADAVLFLVLMNSLDPYYMMGAQIAGAPIIKKYRLEPLPTGYVVVYPDSAVAHVGRIAPIPINKPEIMMAYAMAGEMLGLKYLYIEGGSGVEKPVPPELPAYAKKGGDLVVITGGGIRDPGTAKKIAESGADIIVTGTIVEKDPKKVRKIISAIKSVRSR